MTSDLFLIFVGACAGSVIGVFIMAKVNAAQIASEREDAQRELKRALNDREYWKAQTARYRAVLDGTQGYWPRPLNPK